MSTSDPLPGEDAGVRPSVEDVAQLLRARTKDAEGREVGTFTDETRPTAEQVEDQITTALGLVAVRLPGTWSEGFNGAISALVAYRAALRIEKSYFPEQVRSDRSPYQELKDEYTEDLQALIDALAGAGEAGGFGRTGAYSEWTPTFLRVYGRSWMGDDHWPEPENPENWQVWNQPPREPPLPEDLPVGDAPASGRIVWKQSLWTGVNA
jgi:hypothetical protein